MEVGVVKIAEDRDFEMLKRLVDNHDEWKLDYNKSEIKVWSRCSAKSNYKMVKMHTTFTDIDAMTLYDVLHDPDYRKVWDTYMIESYDIGYLNPNNDVGYYAMACPPPLKNRDFILQRSWLDIGKEQLILNHSINHKDYPPKKGFVRATSLLTGFVIRSTDTNGCFFGYISQTDPSGKLPPWLVNKCTQIFGPKLVKTIHKAAKGYKDWKNKQGCPNFKPWIYPEQMTSPRIKISDCIETAAHKTSNMSLSSYESNAAYFTESD